MTPEQINIAIAEACGVKCFGLMKRGYWYRPNACGYTDRISEAGRYTLEEAKKHESVHGEPDDVKIVELPTPNYYGDLNAIQEAIFSQCWGDSEEVEFQMHLEKAIESAHDDHPSDFYDCVMATAPQRCEAFLKVCGKWVES